MPSTTEIITRYYDELWNHWRYELIPELISPDLTFRGSLGAHVSSRAGFRAYMEAVQRAFPDFSNSIDETIVEWDRAAVRLTYRGTHSGVLYGIHATGRTVEYSGIAIFRISDGLIQSGWVVGDTQSLWRQIGTPQPEIPRQDI